jgi:UDP-galactopyranose mutase
MAMFDALIIGAGFSGLVAAERLCTTYGKRCMVVDKRPHIGGNCYDCLDEHGVLIHPYGPHYFRTNSETVFAYLSQFTRWIPGQYQVKAYTGEKYWSFPVNLETFEQFLDRPSSTDEMESWLQEHCETFDTIENSEQAVLSRFGREFYELFFEGYTLKQWQKHPRELSPSVCGRIPLRTVRDSRYVSEKYQVLPAEGYTRMFENMIEACGDKLTIQLHTDYKDVIHEVKHRHLIFTGPIDAYFEYKHGALPYRTLRFEREYHPTEDLPGNPHLGIPEGYIQPAVQVNYPGPEPWTRCVEAKHITHQRIAGSTLIREFPETYAPGKEPYYPIPFPESREIYAAYKKEAEQLEHVTFLGRLGTYAYINMDQCVSMALKCVDQWITGKA